MCVGVSTTPYPTSCVYPFNLNVFHLFLSGPTLSFMGRRPKPVGTPACSAERRTAFERLALLFGRPRGFALVQRE